MSSKRWIRSAIAGTTILVSAGCATKKHPTQASNPESMQAPSETESAKPRPEAVPAYANEVKSGSGPLSYTAEQPGRLYLVDSDDDVVLYHGELKQNQVFAVDPDAKRATIDGQYVFTREINPNHSHRLFFAPD
jgi:hypothetical protein